MNLLKASLFIFAVACLLNAYACEFPEGEAYPSIAVKGGAIVFDISPIEEEFNDTAASYELGIDVNFLQCQDGTKKTIDQLPFLAETGKVEVAFLADAENDDEKELFVIHSVGIRSDTGVKYSGDYYTVMVYSWSHDSYIKDERLTRYFGNGADILSDDYKDFLYVFPYKDKLSVLNKLASKNYKNWKSDVLVTLTMNRKSLLYSSPVLADATRMYLVAGDKVRQEDVEAGWLSILYSSPTGKDVRGWIQCANADGC